MKEDPFRLRDRILALKLRDVSDLTRSCVSLPYGATVSEARKLVRERGVRTVSVIDPSSQKLLGIVTRGDLLMVSSSKTEATIGSISYEPPVVLSEDDGVRDSLRRMLSYDLWEAPVVAPDGRFRGLFTFGDFISFFVSKDPDYLGGLVVSDFMTRDPVVAYQDDYVAKIWRKMAELRYAGLPVVDSNRRLVGIITQYDLLAKGYTRIHLESESGPSRGPKVRDAMTYSVVFAQPFSTMLDIATVMSKRNIGRIPIVESRESMKLVGIVDREDVVRAILGESRER